MLNTILDMVFKTKNIHTKNVYRDFKEISECFQYILNLNFHFKLGKLYEFLKKHVE